MKSRKEIYIEAHKKLVKIYKLLSAGFVDIEGGIECYGESISLNVKSKDEDKIFLKCCK